MKALVTGSTGFIGSHLLERLVQEKVEVRAQHRRSEVPKELLKFGDKVLPVYDDLDFSQLSDALMTWGRVALEQSKTTLGLALVAGLPELPQALLRKASDLIADSELVIHIAAFANDWGPEDQYIISNVLPIYAILSAIKERGYGKLIFVSSISVHGFGPHVQTKENGTYFDVFNYYQQSKRVAEAIALKFMKEDNLDVIILRPANVYGERDTTTMFHILRALEEKKMGVLASGNFLTTPVFVSDVIECMWLAINKQKPFARIYNIVGPRNYTWKELLKLTCYYLKAPYPKLNLSRGMGIFVSKLFASLNQIFKSKNAPKLTRYRVDQLTSHYDFANGSALTELGYRPKVDLDEGMKRTVESYRGFFKT